MSLHSFDVAVVGAGPFSCFSALLLAQNGIKVALVYPELTEPMDTFVTSLSACWPGLNDPPTRAQVAHGHEVAHYLYNFCSKGSVFFKDFILPIIYDKENWVQSDCLRIGIKDFEIEELNAAYKMGFGLKKTPEKNFYLEEFFSYLCVDRKIFKDKIIQALKKNNVTLVASALASLTETQSKCILKLKNDTTLVSEIVILGNSLNISKILLKFKNILIPMSDCLFEYECHAENNFKFFPFSFRASNGHICATIQQSNDKIQIKISGPRFLLPGVGAGLDLTNVKIESKIFNSIEKFHKDIIFDTISKKLGLSSTTEFFSKFPVSLISKKILVDCYPCDELPIVGEYGKLGKILGTTGWLGTGFAGGAWAAKIMRDLVLNEKSPDLHERLHPRRFFSAFTEH